MLSTSSLIVLPFCRDSRLPLAYGQVPPIQTPTESSLQFFCLVPNAPGTEISSPVSSGNVVLTGSTGVGLAYTSSSSDLVGISRLALHFAAFSEAPLLLTTTSHNTFSEISHILYEVNESTYTSMCKNNECVHRYLFTDDDDDYKYYRE